jgi:hypothetical protein
MISYSRNASSYFFLKIFVKKKEKKERFLVYEEYPPNLKLGSPKSAQLVIQNAAI